jgi:nucleoside-diphosphate kinase
MYAVHEGKDFYEPLVAFATSGPALAMVVRGVGAIEAVRALLGATFGLEAQPGTIRGDFGLSHRYNLVHGSDGPDSARREIALFFRPEELVRCPMGDQAWVTADTDEPADAGQGDPDEDSQG